MCVDGPNTAGWYATYDGRGWSNGYATSGTGTGTRARASYARDVHTAATTYDASTTDAHATNAGEPT